MSNDDYLQYKNLIYKIASKYINNPYLKGYDIEDISQIGAIGLFNAFDKYDETKKANKTTYYYACIEHEILKEIQKNKTVKRYLDTHKDYLQENENEKLAEAILVDENAITDKILQEVEDEEIINSYYEEIYETLKGQQRHLLINKLFYEEDDHETAARENISVEAVRMAIIRAKRNLIKNSTFIQQRKKLVLDAYINYFKLNPCDIAMREII